MVAYDVYDKKYNGLPAIIDGTAEQCGKLMGLTVSSFKSYVTLAKKGEIKRWEVVSHMMRKCACCGDKFRPSRRTQIYCSVKCRNRQTRRNQHAKVAAEIKMLEQDQERERQLLLNRRRVVLKMRPLSEMTEYELLHYGRIQSAVQLGKL